MARPILIDTDMGIDDAAALCLALAAKALDLRAVVSVGGNVDRNQATDNIRRLLGAIQPSPKPRVGVGLDPEGPLPADRRARYGGNGFGDSDLPIDETLETSGFQDVYRQAAETADGELEIVALGPLTNLAALVDRSPGFFERVKRICICGGAVWTKADGGAPAEFNFRRDPRAAARVLGAGLPISVCPLDVSRLVCLDESHAAHFAASGARAAGILAPMLRFAVESDAAPGPGKAILPDLLALGSLIWPELFLRTRMRLDIVAEGEEAGRCKPALGGDPSRRVDLLTAVNAVDFLENVLESLCRESFVV